MKSSRRIRPSCRELKYHKCTMQRLEPGGISPTIIVYDLDKMLEKYMPELQNNKPKMVKPRSRVVSLFGRPMRRPSSKKQ